MGLLTSTHYRGLLSIEEMVAMGVFNKSFKLVFGQKNGLPIPWKAISLSIFSVARLFCLGFFASVTRKLTTAGQSGLNPEAGENPFISDIPDCNNTDQGEKIHRNSFD
jgi:hypothetical protein